MKNINFKVIHRTALNFVLCSAILFASLLWGVKPAHADMYKYVKKDGSTLLTGKRLRGSRYRLIKVYKIKKSRKKKSYKSSSRKKKRSKYKKRKRKYYSKSKKRKLKYGLPPLQNL